VHLIAEFQSWLKTNDPLMRFASSVVLAVVAVFLTWMQVTIATEQTRQGAEQTRLAEEQTRLAQEQMKLSERQLSLSEQLLAPQFACIVERTGEDDARYGQPLNETISVRNVGHPIYRLHCDCVVYVDIKSVPPDTAVFGRWIPVVGYYGRRIYEQDVSGPSVQFPGNLNHKNRCRLEEELRDLAPNEWPPVEFNVRRYARIDYTDAFGSHRTSYYYLELGAGAIPISDELGTHAFSTYEDAVSRGQALRFWQATGVDFLARCKGISSNLEEAG